jgi:hypothetical protein
MEFYCVDPRNSDPIRVPPGPVERPRHPSDQAPFSRYRARLAALVNGAAARTALCRASHLTRFWSPYLTWTPMFGRFDPDANPYVVQVVESFTGGMQRLARIEAFDTYPQQTADAEAWHEDAVVGFLRVIPLVADPALPTLARTLAVEQDARVVRYHAGVGVTVRCMRNDRLVYGRMFRDDRGKDLFEMYHRLWCASIDRAVAVNIARPLEWDDQTGVLWQVALPGYAVRPRLAARDGIGVARQLGEALGSLAESDISAPHRNRDDDMNRMRDCASDLARRVPGAVADVAEFFERVAVLAGCVQGGAPRPVHGAPLLHRWLATSERLGVVGFDSFAAGDAELDVGTLVAEFDDGRAGSSAQCLADAAIAGWQAAAGPLDHALLALYRGLAHLRSAHTIACGLDPGADERARVYVRRGLAALSDSAAV